MSDLRSRLDDMLVAVPGHVVSDDLATRARSAGRRRRRTRRVGVIAVVVAAVTAVALALGLWPHPPFRPPVADLTARADGYPTRIHHPWTERSLPEAPGPIAGLVRREDGDARDDRTNWWAVSERGALRRLPGHDFDIDPVLSPSGSRLVYFVGPSGHAWDGHPRLWDLVTGTQVTVEDIGSNADNVTAATYVTQQQVPGFWSPDEENVLLWAWTDSDPAVRGVVVDWDGHVTVPHVQGVRAALPVGWVDNERLGWLSPDGRAGHRSVRLLITDLAGSVQSSMTIGVPRARIGNLSQWSGALSPDGARLALRSDASGSDPIITTIDMSSGTRVETWRPVALNDVAPLAWQDGHVVGATRPDSGAVLVSSDGDRPLVRADPRLQVGPSTWAADALAGTPHRDPVDLLTGNSDWGPLWWWREMALGAVVLVVGLSAWWRLRRRRTRPVVAP